MNTWGATCFQSLRYRPEMKKASRNLVLRSETLRTLPNVDLVRAVGGFQSADKPCRLVVVYDTEVHACTERAVATAACG